MNSRKKFILLTLEFHKEDDVWVGVCKELGTAADGDKFEDVIEILKEFVILQLNTLEDVGECKKFLREHGVKIHNQQEIPLSRIPANNDPNLFINRQLIPIGSC